MDYILRDVDDKLWKHFKERAEGEGRTLRWVLTVLLTHYIKHGLPTGR